MGMGAEDSTDPALEVTRLIVIWFLIRETPQGAPFPKDLTMNFNHLTTVYPSNVACRIQSFSSHASVSWRQTRSV